MINMVDGNCTTGELKEYGSLIVKHAKFWNHLTLGVDSEYAAAQHLFAYINRCKASVLHETRQYEMYYKEKAKEHTALHDKVTILNNAKGNIDVQAVTIWKEGVFDVKLAFECSFIEKVIPL